VGVEELAARLVAALLGVRAEEVALGLGSAWRQPLLSGNVEERQGRGQCGGSGPREWTAAANTGRQPAWARSSSPVKYGSSIRLVSFGLRSNASLILPRKALRMMQPPRHIRATAPLLISQPDSLAIAFIRAYPWAYEMILLA